MPEIKHGVHHLAELREKSGRQAPYISFEEIASLEGVNNPERQQQMTRVLEQIESTREGQKIFANIKAQDKPLYIVSDIVADDRSETEVMRGTRDTDKQPINVMYINYEQTRLMVYNYRGEEQRNSLQRTMFEELFHAADPKVQRMSDKEIEEGTRKYIETYSRSSADGGPSVPAYEKRAVEATDRFMKKYYGEPPRSSYKNFYFSRSNTPPEEAFFYPEITHSRGKLLEKPVTGQDKGRPHSGIDDAVLDEAKALVAQGNIQPGSSVDTRPFGKAQQDKDILPTPG